MQIMVGVGKEDYTFIIKREEDRKKGHIYYINMFLSK